MPGVRAGGGQNGEMKESTQSREVPATNIGAIVRQDTGQK